jgi:hypothetical protein
MESKYFIKKNLVEGEEFGLTDEEHKFSLWNHFEVRGCNSPSVTRILVGKFVNRSGRSGP